MTAALGDPCPPTTRAELGWDRLLAALAAHCVSERGRAAALDLPFLASRQAVSEALAEVAEAATLRASGEGLVRPPLADLFPLVQRAQRGLVLEALEILDLGEALAAARALRATLRARAADFPQLALACGGDDALDALTDELTRSNPAHDDAARAGLSARVREQADAVARALDALARADLREACALLAAQLDLWSPVIDGAEDPTDGLRFELREVRHPLLALDGAVVPSTLELSTGRGLVVSGPDGGGKSTLLATLGLVALMVRAGLPIPAAAGSRVALVGRVLVSFTPPSRASRLARLAAILEEAGPSTLVVLDDLESGTSAREGAALGRAVAERLVERGAAVVLSTQTEGLLGLPAEDVRFASTSLGFDLARDTPTFRASTGAAHVPGTPEALAAGRRAGLDGALLARAQDLLAVAAPVAERFAYRAPQPAPRKAPAPEPRPGADGGVPLPPRSKGAPLDLPKREEPERPGVGAVTVGMKVFVPRLRTEAQVVEVLGGGQVRVAAGPLKLLTSIDELQAAKPAPTKAASGGAGGARRDDRPRRTTSVPFDAAADPDLPIQTSSNTVDLRGLRAHEAVGMAEQFLDRCLGQGLRVAFLIHGHGTGALRKEIRDAIKTSPYVERSRPGEHGEGGDGVTVVWLR